MTLKNDLLELERGFWRAAGDRAFYEKNMADDGLLVFAGEGAIIDKASGLGMVEGAEPWDQFDIDDVRILELSDEAAVLVYAAEATRGGSAKYRANISTAYVRRDGRWQLVLHQQSPIES